MDVDVTGELVEWRGPAPFHFVAVPDEAADRIAAVAREVTYGWGVIPVTVRLGTTTWTTSLFPKDGGYLVPVKAAVRRVERADLGDVLRLRLTIGR